MATQVKRTVFLAAVLVGACAACADAGGRTASMRESEALGGWTNAAGARLTLGADRRMAGTALHNAMLGGTSCPDAVTGHWAFFGPLGDANTVYADDSFTSGDIIDLDIRSSEGACLMSAQVHRDARGFSLCLVEDPDSGCSARELLRPAPHADAAHGSRTVTRAARKSGNNARRASMPPGAKK
ncbi:hypothetical protein ACF1BE_22440 [Streptomyces sp. NPDC014991]|uniref:hypothetical protein n=1 Tax=Streptomyces sp. NPDC014991 TaxID=3364935 RepID=UPI003701E2CB